MINKDSDSKFLKWLIIIIIVLSVVFLVSLQNSENSSFLLKKDKSKESTTVSASIDNNEKNYQPYNDDFNVLPTMEDSLNINNVWSGSLNIAWKQLIDKYLAGKFSEVSVNSVNYLNNSTIKKSDLEGLTYYTKAEIKYPDLKDTIISDLGNDLKSHVPSLDFIQWYINDDHYFVFSALTKNVTFQNQFTKIEKDSKQYIGINENSNSTLYDQVSVLTYDQINNKYAVNIKTIDGHLILAKGFEGNCFKDIYDSINKEKYNGPKIFTQSDTLLFPELNIEAKDAIRSLINVTVKGNGSFIKVSQVVNSSKVTIKNGGTQTRSNDNSIENLNGTRNFLFDKNFVVFLINDGASHPYFAANVTDTELFKK